MFLLFIVTAAVSLGLFLSWDSLKKIRYYGRILEDMRDQSAELLAAETGLPAGMIRRWAKKYGVNLIGNCGYLRLHPDFRVAVELDAPITLYEGFETHGVWFPYHVWRY